MKKAKKYMKKAFENYHSDICKKNGKTGSKW